MVTTTEAERRRNVVQTIDSWKLAGFEPDADYLALLERYVEGKITLAEISARVEAGFGIGTGKPL